MKCINKTKNLLVVENVILANTYFSRLRGLLGKKSLGAGEGMLLKPCNAIHMMFMRFNIDAVFISKDNKVVYILKNFRKWRFSKIVGNAASTLELAAGASEGKFDIGDELSFE